MHLIYEVELNSNFEFEKKRPYLNKKEFKQLALLNDVILHKDDLCETTAVWKLFFIQLQNSKSELLEQFEEQSELFEQLLSNPQLSKIDTRKYKSFFRFLIQMHFEFKNTGHFKLMWNLENLFLRKSIKLLLGNGVSFSKLEKLSHLDDCAYLYSIQKRDDEEYFECFSELFFKEPMLEFLKRKYSLEKKQVFTLLFSNKEHYTTLHSIIELYKRYKRDNYNEHLLLALLRSVVINVEHLVKDLVGEYTKEINSKNSYVIENIKREKEVDEVSKNKIKLFQFDMYDYLRVLSTNGKLDSLKEQYDNTEFHKRLEFLQVEPTSKDKYFYILLKARNHLAHGCGDFNKFVLHHDSNLTDVLDSVIFTFIYLEYLKGE